MDLLGDLVAADKKIKTITAQATQTVAATHTTVIDVYVVGPVTAASVIGKVLDVACFADADHFASYNTTAPVEWGSGGGTGPFILNPGGNRRLNHAMHVIAVTQRHNDTPGRSYCSREVPIGSGVWERRVDQQEAQGCFRRRASPAAGAR